MVLEILHLAFVLHRRRPSVKRAEVAALARAGIGLARIKPVFAPFQCADHHISSLVEERATSVPDSAWLLLFFPAAAVLFAVVPRLNRLQHVVALGPRSPD